MATGSTSWDGASYQARFDRLAAEGVDLHGEADLVCRWSPGTVLDAGCGTGRVAIELARRGIEVVGVDVDASMLATARGLAPELPWIEADLCSLDLGRQFDLVLLAGNVPLFTPPGTQGALVAACARHLGAGGRLVAGFSLGRGYDLRTYDADTAAAGLALVDRWSTWDQAPYDAGADYAVSVHRRPIEGAT